ncbi:MAG: TatD family hydrolase [Limisphaerales bacterium]
MATFFDSHAHLTWPDFAGELDEVVARAKEQGIERIVTIGTDLESSAKAVELAERIPEVFAVVGWHPGDVMAGPEDIREELKPMAQHKKVVAIGETGLDYFRLPSGRGGTPEEDEILKRKQAEYFVQQLEVAVDVGLNVVIHTRGDCFDETLEILEPYADRLKAVFHCFVETPANMRRVLDVGSIVSFTGIVTFKNAQDVRDTVLATPINKLMVETDSPFLAPVPRRGKRCEPALVRHTAEKVAEIKGCTLEELSAATCATARSFYRGLT